MRALLLAFLLGGSERPAAPGPPPRLYEPRPWAEWSGGIDLKEVAPVVVVASRRRDGEAPVLFGNGVVIDSRAASSWVLTCAHVIRPGFEAEIRVGVFRHSFVTDVEDRADYRELEARLLRADAGRDLALLEIAAGVRAARIHSRDEILWPRHVVSIVPFGKPTLLRGFHPFLRPGQSGSPNLADGVVFGLARGMGYLPDGSPAYGLESFIEAAEIQAFLAELEFPLNFCDPSV